MSSLMMYASSSSLVSATTDSSSSVPVMNPALVNPRKKRTTQPQRTNACSSSTGRRRRQSSQIDMIQKTRKPKKIMLGRPCHGKQKMTVDELKALSRRICLSDNNNNDRMHAITDAAHHTQQPYTAETIVSLSRHLKENLFRAKTKMMDSLKHSDEPQDVRIYHHLTSHSTAYQHHLDNNSKFEMACTTPTTTQTMAATPSPEFGATNAAAVTNTATMHTNATTTTAFLNHNSHPHTLDITDMETEEEEEEDDYSSVSTTLSSVHQFPHQRLCLVTNDNGHVSVKAHPSKSITTVDSVHTNASHHAALNAATTVLSTPVASATDASQETDHFGIRDTNAFNTDTIVNSYIASAIIPFYTPMTEASSLCHSSSAYTGLIEQCYQAFYWPTLFNNTHVTGTASGTENKDEVTEDQINSWLQRGGYSDVTSMTMATDQELAALVDFDHL